MCTRLAWLLVGVGVGSSPTPGAERVNPPPPTNHAPSSEVQDDHRYYTLTVTQNNAANSFDDNFIDMEHADVKNSLSDTMVGAELISPLFTFPFYGHPLSELYVTTHGFLSLSPKLHDYIYKTQYIAPLRIKLDPSRSNSSTISVLSLPERLTVEWSNVSVMESAEHPSGGSFTFQVTLYPNGDIVFVYIEVQPVLTTAALYDHEPVAGISDAFLLHGSELHLYNKINIDNIDINTRTVAVFRHLPTCVQQESCGSCLDLRLTTNFTCFWCEAAGHCSDGADRLREHWNSNACHLVNSSTTCPTTSSGHTEWRTSSLSQSDQDPEAPATSTIVSAVISSILVLILLAILVTFLYLYGRYNEDSLVGRHLKRLTATYERFGGAAASSLKMTSLELGKKKSQAAAAKAAKTKPVSEFVNPIGSMATNNNVITASM
jgi:hypothetical protein